MSLYAEACILVAALCGLRAIWLIRRIGWRGIVRELRQFVNVD